MRRLRAPHLRGAPRAQRHRGRRELASPPVAWRDLVSCSQNEWSKPQQEKTERTEIRVLPPPGATLARLAEFMPPRPGLLVPWRLPEDWIECDVPGLAPLGAVGASRQYHHRRKNCGVDLGSAGTHPGGMKEGSRGSKRSEPPGPAMAYSPHPGGMPEGCLRKGCVWFWHPVPGCRTLAALDRGSPQLSDPRLPSANPPGCAPSCRPRV